MLPEERARKKIDHQLQTAGWDIVSRDEYIPNSASAVKEAYGDGFREVGTYYAYDAGDGKSLQFLIENDSVKEIDYYYDV